MWYQSISLWGILLIGIFLILVYLFALRGGRLTSLDGKFYYSYLHTIYFDGDLNFHNEYSHFGLFGISFIRRKTPTGLWRNLFSVGPAIMWSPFYLLAHLTVTTNNLLGGSLEADGYSYPYYTAITLGSLIYAFFGLVLIYLILKRYFSSSLSFLAIIALLFSSFLIWYMVYEPSMAHSVSFFTTSLFLFLWLQDKEKRSYRSWLILGLSAGLMIVVRWQNVVFLLLPAIYSLLKGIKLLRKRNYSELIKLFLFLIVFTSLILLLFSPQMLIWKSLYGKFLTIPHGDKFVLWHRAMVWELLFSSRHGLLSWTPLVYFSLIGLPLFFKKDKELLLYLSAIFILMIYLNSIVGDWWAGAAFGSRRFTSCLPIIALGFASLADFLCRKPKILLVGFISALACWNILFLMQFKKGEIPPSLPISFKEVAHRQIEKIYAKTGYLFSFPANLLFSLKYGVSPAKYDMLIGRYPHQPSIDIGRNDEIYIGRGWSYPQGDKRNINFRWSDSWESTLLIPLHDSRNYQLDLRMRPYWVASLPQQRVDIWINNRFLVQITLKEGYFLYNIPAPSSYWKKGVNEIEFRYRYIISPAKAVSSKDARRLGIALDYVKLKRIK